MQYQRTTGNPEKGKKLEIKNLEVLELLSIIDWGRCDLCSINLSYLVNGEVVEISQIDFLMIMELMRQCNDWSEAILDFLSSSAYTDDSLLNSRCVWISDVWAHFHIAGYPGVFTLKTSLGRPNINHPVTKSMVVIEHLFNPSGPWLRWKTPLSETLSWGSPQDIANIFW